VKVFPGCLVLRLINSFTIVASAMAPDSRSDDEDGAIPPQPFGPMAQLFMRRNTSNRLSCDQVFSLYLTAA